MNAIRQELSDELPPITPVGLKGAYRSVEAILNYVFTSDQAVSFSNKQKKSVYKTAMRRLHCACIFLA